ncbi:hypothetical protein BSKO_09936 [Bryopsis sp. KO-2023]|nr:hypothetical protein BSKO_09936 [Bryopsis sp. KO-2023]
MDPRLQPYTLKTETQFLFPQFRFRAPPGNDHEVRSDELQQRFTSIRIPYIHEAEPPPRFRSAVCAAYHDFIDGQAGWDADLSERSLVALIETCSREVLATLRCELEPAFVREKCFDAEASRGEAAKWILQGGEIGTTRIENCVPLLSISSKKAQWIGFKEVAKDAGRENVVCGDQTACYAELGDSIVRRRTVEAGIVKRGRLNDYVLRGGGPTASWKREHLELCTEILDENSGEVSFAFEDKFHEWKAEFCVEHGGKGDERAPSDGVCREGVAELGRQIPGLTRVTPRNVGRQNTGQPSTAKFIINLENGKLDQSATLQEKEASILCESLNTHETALDVLLSAALQELESIFEGESFPEWPIQSDPKAAPFLQLFAADAVPDCEFRRLPVVVLMGEDPCEKLEAESKLETWREGVELCAVKPQSVCHLELYLDWGLSDPVASTTKKGIDDMLREWKPQRSPFCQPKRKDAIAMMIQQDCKADPFQEIACNKVQSTPPEANGVPRQITQRKSSKSTPLQGCFEQTRAATIQESDTAAGGLKINKKMDIQDDFDFFLELHSSKRAQEKDGNQSVMETEPKTIDQKLETAQEIETEPEVRVENVPLPPSMTSLLVQLAKEHDGVVLSCNGLPEGVTKSGLMDVEAMTVTLKGLAEVKGSRESPPIEVFQTCSLLVVLRQTAVLLLHFGPRVGFLYMKQSMNDLVALRGRLCDISKLLAEAYFDVERGKTWDHPKLDALKNVLTLSTDGKAKVLIAQSYLQNEIKLNKTGFLTMHPFSFFFLFQFQAMTKYRLVFQEKKSQQVQVAHFLHSLIWFFYILQCREFWFCAILVHFSPFTPLSQNVASSLTSLIETAQSTLYRKKGSENWCRKP